MLDGCKKYDRSRELFDEAQILLNKYGGRYLAKFKFDYAVSCEM